MGVNEPNRAIDYVIANAGKFAQAKANRIYLEEFRKSKKALLMNQSTEKTVNAREQYAYSHDEYLALLDGLKAAIEVEEKLKWELEAARLRVEIFKTQSFADRQQDRTMR
jgi:hypothetical protein